MCLTVRDQSLTNNKIGRYPTCTGMLIGGSSLTNEKDHHYFLNRFVCVGEFFDG